MVCVICMLDSMGSRLFGHRDLLYLTDRQTRGEEDLQCDLHKRGGVCKGERWECKGEGWKGMCGIGGMCVKRRGVSEVQGGA